jgi:hypothetical protein
MEDQPEAGRLLDVVLTSGVVRHHRRYDQIDWTQVADWRYAATPATQQEESK